MMRLILSSLVILVETLTLFILMCLLKGKGTESNNSISGLILQRISTLTPFFGILELLCMYILCQFAFQKLYFCQVFYCSIGVSVVLSNCRFYVDGRPIRVFKNNELIGVAFPKNQPMRIYSSLWNADDWATRGGRVKTDWSKAPFTATFREFNASACVSSSGV